MIASTLKQDIKQKKKIPSNLIEDYDYENDTNANNRLPANSSPSPTR